MSSKSWGAGRSTISVLLRDEIAAAEARLKPFLDKGPWSRLSFLLFSVILLVAAITFRDYGLTWDEENHRIYGDAVINWYSTLFTNHDAIDKWRLFVYGGFFDGLAQLVARFSPVGVYETRHAVNVLFGILGIVAAYRIGSRLAGALVGFLSALFLALTPVYYGHMFNNPKDVPFAALFLLSLYYALVSYDHLPHVPKRLLLQLGIAVGLTTGIRAPGFLILGYVGLLWLAWIVGRVRGRSLPKGEGLPRILGTLALSLASSGVIAWVVMLICWPWAQTSPILNPLRSLLGFTDYDWPLTVLYKGYNIRADQLPPSYLPTWVAISLPEFYFVGAAAGSLMALRVCLGRRWDLHRWDLLSKVGLLVLSASTPILAQIVLHSTVYDGLRQFLFVVPPMAILAAFSLVALFRSRVLLPIKLLAAAAVLFSAGLTVVDMAQLHPYEYIYFNRLVAGGLESAASRFDTEYYGASYREGILWLEQNYHPATTERIRVSNPSKPFLTAYYLEANDEVRKRFVSVPDGDNPNVYLAITRWNKYKEEGTVLHVVSRKGLPLLYIIEQRKPS